MIGDREIRIWVRIVEQARGGPVSLAQVCAAAVATVGVEGAGLTVVVTPTVRETLSATDAVAADLEELQLTLGQGPCLDTFTNGGPVLADDLRSSEFFARWPLFAPAALDAGALAVFALPLHIGAISLGVLDLYRASRAGWTCRRWPTRWHSPTSPACCSLIARRVLNPRAPNWPGSTTTPRHTRRWYIRPPA